MDLTTTLIVSIIPAITFIAGYYLGFHRGKDRGWRDSNWEHLTKDWRKK